MSDVKVVLDEKAVRQEILQADYMQKYINAEAEREAGSDCHVKSFIGFSRAVSIIYPNTKEFPG